MHILQLLPCLEVGGVERGVVDLARGLIARGHRVTVVSAGGALVEPLVRAGAAHHTLPVDRKSPWAVWQNVPVLCALIRRTGVDVVHARSRMPAWAGWLAAWRTGVPFMTTCHGFYAPHPASRVMAWGRTVIVPSEALGRYCIDELQVPPERLRVIPRGVDPAEFPFRPRPPASAGAGWRVGLIGRFTALKGHEVAIRALAQLIHGPRRKISLCFIGDAPADKPHLRQRLADLAASLGVSESIEWLGTRQDIPACLAALDAVVVPSVYPESFGRSVIEAQAVGVPVIASRLGALAEVVEDGQTGLLVPPGDPAALAAALARLMEDAPLARRLVEQGRARVEQRYSVDRMVDETLAVYQDVKTAPRLVVWKLSALGDVVLSTPSLRAIRKQFPESRIALIVGRQAYDAVARCPYVNEVWVYDPSKRDRMPAGKLKFLRRLQRAGFDRSIDLQNSRFTHGMAWLAGIPVRVGYARKGKRFLNRAVPLPTSPMAPVAHQHVLLHAAGIEPDGDALEVWTSAADDERAATLLRALHIESGKPMVGLHPGGSARWQTKRWEPARWAGLSDRLAERGVQVVITGSLAEQRLAQQIRERSRSKPAILAGQTTLLELACVLRRCQAVVTLDSSPLHVAAALGVPVIGLFGPTDPERHLPRMPNVRAIKKDVFCSPCYSTWCRTVTHACMQRITVDEVHDIVREALGVSTGRSAASRPEAHAARTERLKDRPGRGSRN